ncbi:MAG: hypothetical protein RBS16_08285 [Candidatus Cloacimonadales bacterium]|nr:hypothetical protein [Candidatus Cloacimonadales bacterium]
MSSEKAANNISLRSEKARNNNHFGTVNAANNISLRSEKSVNNNNFGTGNAANNISLRSEKARNNNHFGTENTTNNISLRSEKAVKTANLKTILDKQLRRTKKLILKQKFINRKRLILNINKKRNN